jgi:diketogulonate reductase-like aldo/keto reductase
MALNRTFTLNTGAKIPAVGFGTWQAAPKEVEKAVENALKAGYRHIDCAAIYRNEAEVGAGIKASNVKREDIFITTKLWNTNHDSEADVEKALDKSLRDLGVEHVDLYLMHWPVAFALGAKWFPLDDQGVFKLSNTPFTTTWQYMEKLLQTGKVKAIGVSNFNVRRLKELLSVCKTRPATNQIEAHPYLQQSELFDFCQKEGILIEAYSPLGNNQTGEPKTLDDAEVHAVGKDLGMDPGQVLVSWGVQRGTVVLPKSVTAKRIASNFQDQVLPDNAMDRLNALERHKRFNFPARWGYDIFDEFGDAEVKRIAKEAGPENLEKFTV